MGKRTPQSDGTAATNFLRQWREYRKLSQKTVQQLNGWRYGRVYNIEAGRTLLTDRILESLARTYDCTIDELLHHAPPGIRPVAPPPPARVGSLHDVLPILAQISKNAESIRDDLGGRLDALEAELATAREKVAEAIRESADLRDALERAAEILQPIKKNGEPNAA